jgi:iron(III) transport system permease protein
VDNTLTLKYYIPSTILGADSSVLEASSSEGLPLIFKSIKVIGFAALIGGLFAVVVGYVVVRLRGILSKILGYVVFMPSALPGVVFAIGYILAFNAPFGETALALTGTIWILIFIIVFTKIVAGVLATQSVLQKADVSVEEAAISLGASRLYTFRRVIFPVLRKPWLLGSLYVFVSGLVSLSRTIFLVTPEYPLAAPAICLNAVEGKYGIACVLSTYLIVVVLIAMIFIRFVEKRDKYARAVTSQINAKPI